MPSDIPIDFPWTLTLCSLEKNNTSHAWLFTQLDFLVQKAQLRKWPAIWRTSNTWKRYGPRKHNGFYDSVWEHCMTIIAFDLSTFGNAVKLLWLWLLMVWDNFNFVPVVKKFYWRLRISMTKFRSRRMLIQQKALSEKKEADYFHQSSNAASMNRYLL